MAHLFIPGPTDVDPSILAAQAQTMIGHRSVEGRELFDRIQARLRQVFQTTSRVYVSTSSGSGLQEAAVRNCVAERVLMCVCGAFGERWHEIALANGIPADRLDVEWGRPTTPDQVEEALRAGTYDAVAIVHNESSTGVETPIAAIADRVRQVAPDTLILVDAVSSLAGVDLRPDEWALDVLLTSSQKCFALPPGLSFAAVSDRALDRARTLSHRGWYFDFLLYEEYLAKGGTPATPAMSLLFALDRQLDRILSEGLPARFARHERMAVQVQDWASRRFEPFAAEGYRSKTVTAIRKSSPIDIPSLNAFLARDGMTIADGYGPLKPASFRIGHMGEIQPSDVSRLLDRIDDFLDHPTRRATAR
jgi:predicted phosphoserine aminotransferase